MTRIGFYAPMKPPTHPVPSGDRAMGRAILKALQTADASALLASTFRSYDGTGDASRQAELITQAKPEADSIIADANIDVWVTYHNYYKAPDLIGPHVSRALSIPYLLIEATRAKKRLDGPWAHFAQASEHACDTADTIFYLTERDAVSLLDHKTSAQNILPLPPFLPLQDLPAETPAVSDPQLLAIGMMRPGDKLASYGLISQVLPLLQTKDFKLTIVGDGPARVEVEQVFAPFGDRVQFTGQLPPAEIALILQKSLVFLWPGVNEAFGIVYLEAQSHGIPAVAQNRPGVRDVLPQSSLCAIDDLPAYAQLVDILLTDDAAHKQAAQRARQVVAENHLLPAASARISSAISELLGRKK